MSLRYEQLSKDIENKILEDKENQRLPGYGFSDQNVVRRNDQRDSASIVRPAFVRDIEKILHCPYYNRYADKTQVFSFYRNDDISRRALHVQLVSRIARNIGRVLNLNEDLIEAIALGHDIGHTPFGHAGERILNQIYKEHTGRVFNHNVHSVRVLDGIFKRNISLQTLDGIICHNGELVRQEYRPHHLTDFIEFDQKVERTYTDPKYNNTLVPSTMEGCLVRLCDMIAYLGKDRQDAKMAGIFIDNDTFTKGEIGVENAELIHNLSVNIIENSYGKDYIMLDESYYDALSLAKTENYRVIYGDEKANLEFDHQIKPMFYMMYDKLRSYLLEGDTHSIIFTHHVDYIRKHQGYYVAEDDYLTEDVDQIVVDYLASMTDDYFVDLFHYLFPDSHHKVEYIPYFNS